MDENRGELDNVPLPVLDMKEEDYSVTLIPTYGGNEQVREDKFCRQDNLQEPG